MNPKQLLKARMLPDQFDIRDLKCEPGFVLLRLVMHDEERTRGGIVLATNLATYGAGHLAVAEVVNCGAFQYDPRHGASDGHDWPLKAGTMVLLIPQCPWDVTSVEGEVYVMARGSDIAARVGEAE